MNSDDNLSSHTRLKSPLSLQETNEAPATERSADFGESACGEPLSSQHILIDFTPNADDTEFVQKKCCAFWDFISTCPELEYYKVRPEQNYSERTERMSDIELAPLKRDNIQNEHVKTAVSMLEFVEEKGLITRAFEAKFPQSGCSVGSPAYFDDKLVVSNVNKKDEINSRMAKGCNCKKVCKSCKAKILPESPRKPSSVQEMCKALQDWDIHHPTSMDPPGHPPALNQ